MWNLRVHDYEYPYNGAYYPYTHSGIFIWLVDSTKFFDIGIPIWPCLYSSDNYEYNHYRRPGNAQCNSKINHNAYCQLVI